MTKSRSIFLYILFLIPFFEPISIYYLISPKLSFVFSSWRILNSVLVILILSRKTFKIQINIFAFFLCFLLVSLLNSGNFLDASCEIIKWYSFFLITYYALKTDFYAFIKAIYLLFFILVTINCIFMFFFPRGVIINSLGSYYDDRGWSATMYDYINFLERDNRLINWLIPLWLSSILLYLKKELSKKKYLFTLFVILITLYKSWSATTLVGASILLLLTISIRFKWEKVIKFFNEKKVILILVFANIYILFFNNSIGSFLGKIIQNWLKKDITFTGRTTIWNEAIRMIKESFFLGYGTENRGYIVNNFYAHNMILDILIQGGILLFFSFLFLILYKKKKSKKGEYKNSFVIEKRIFLFGLMSFGIMGLTESLFYQYSFWLILAIFFALNNAMEGS